MMAKLFCEAGAVISHFVFIAEIMVLGHLIFHAVVCYFDFFTQVDKYLLLQIGSPVDMKYFQMERKARH